MSWYKFAFCLIGFLFYAAALELLGYIAASFFFLFYMFKVADTSGWRLPLCAALGGGAGLFFLFHTLLGAALP